MSDRAVSVPIFVTLNGSHAWNNTETIHDVDIFAVYAQDPSEVLVGDIPKPECIQNLPLVDLNRFEIGHVVRQLEKGNINFIVGVMSPRVIVTSLWHKGLKRVFRDNPSRALCNSILGLAEGHLKKYGDCVDDDLRLKKLAHAILS